MPVDPLGDRTDLVLGEAAEGVLHHLEVVVEMSGALTLGGQRSEEIRSPEAGTEGPCGVEGTRVDPPGVLATEQLAGYVVDDIGAECAGDAGLDISLGAVVEQVLGRGDCGCGVCKVVGDDLVVVHRATGCEMRERSAHNTIGQIERSRCIGEVGHAGTLPSVPAVLTAGQWAECPVPTGGRQCCFVERWAARPREGTTRFDADSLFCAGALRP